MPITDGLIGATIGAAGQIGSNMATRRWQEKMYIHQRRHALEDRDYADWYNTPLEQRKRLEAGGLNPALMYKGGSGTQGAAPTRSSSTGNYKAENILDPLAIAQLRKTEAETEAIALDNNYKDELYNEGGVINIKNGNEVNVISYGGKAQRDAIEQVRRTVQQELDAAKTGEEMRRIRKHVQVLNQQFEEIKRLNAWGLVRGINWEQGIQGIIRKATEIVTNFDNWNTNPSRKK